MGNERLYMTRDEALVALSGPQLAAWDLPKPLQECRQGWLLAADFDNAVRATASSQSVPQFFTDFVSNVIAPEE